MDRRCDLLLFVATQTELERLKAAAQGRELRFDRIENEHDSATATTYRANPELLKILEAYREKVTRHRVLPGCLLTGSARVRSEAYRNDLVRWCSHIAPEIVGGEMEGFGLLALAPKARPNWMIVKGICDFADGNQESDAEANRALACENAATFVLDALGAWKPDPTETIEPGEPYGA